MIFSYWEWETQTMFFEDSKELQRFLLSFKETTDFFNLLKNKTFIFKPKKNKVTFYFKHETREEYITTHDQLKETEIKKFLYTLGWRLVDSGSAITHAPDTKT
jgi:hypothetical protein